MGVVIPSIVFGVCYIFHLGIVFCMHETWEYLQNIKVSGVNDILTYVERIKASPPVVSMSCLCYHYETRTRDVTEYYTENVNGQYVSRSRTRTETYQEQVVTYRGYELFNYREWLDVSGSLSNGLYNHNMARIHFSKTWTAGDQQTQAAFDCQYDTFKKTHKHRDIYFSSYFDVDIQGYEPVVLSVIEKKWYVGRGIYVMATLLFLAVFYAYWFDRHSVKGKFEFKKTVKL